MRSEQFRGQDCAQAGKALYQRDKAHDMKRRRGIVEKRKKPGAMQSQRQRLKDGSVFEAYRIVAWCRGVTPLRLSIAVADEPVNGHRRAVLAIA
jgi:hypothetical protein